jgi:hypothetical protein
VERTRHDDARAHVAHRIRPEIALRALVLGHPRALVASREHGEEVREAADALPVREQAVVGGRRRRRARLHGLHRLHALRHHAHLRLVELADDTGDVELDPQMTAGRDRRRQHDAPHAARDLTDGARDAIETSAARDGDGRRLSARHDHVREHAQHDVIHRRALGVRHPDRLAQAVRAHVERDRRDEIVERQLREIADLELRRQIRAHRGPHVRVHELGRVVPSLRGCGRREEQETEERADCCTHATHALHPAPSGTFAHRLC